MNPRSSSLFNSIRLIIYSKFIDVQPDSEIMPARKKQHYVPKLYMRGWCPETEKLPSYQLDRRQEFPPTSIHYLCYEDYFYSDDAEQEEATMKMEDRFAAVLQDFRNEQTLSALDSEEEWMYVLTFLTHTHKRTKNAKKESQELTHELLRLLLEANEGAMEGDDEEMRQTALEMLEEDKIQVKNSPAFPMGELVSMYGPLLIGDLKVALLRDATGMGFIFSDHPVVLDNPMFQEEIRGTKTGFQTRGIQIFCPISPDLTLMMYDPDCYRIPGTGVVDVGSDVVTDLNKLQMVNVLDAVFYQTEGRESEMRVLHDEVEDLRPENMTDVDRFDADDPRFDTNNEVFGIGSTAPGFSPELPFVEELDAEFALIRSPEMYARYKSMIKDARDSAKEELTEDE
ncbi:DUF4238 domain-containing protein [Halorubrum sp. FL23]|uniref:DUF4238 domain-containing protein n=1 Tax=Halorubrum sp. FL23 TaxID=3458704 RepID=UPI004034BD7F